MINYSYTNGIATIHFDDGKANVFSVESVAAMQEALDRAEQEAKALVWRGRKGQFSAGFDLKVIQAGDSAKSKAQLLAGFEVLCRLFNYPLPVVTVSEGHAIGMGAFLLLSADIRIALDAPCKIGLPETAIAMPFDPELLMIIARERVNPQHYRTAILHSRMHQPSEAKEAGFLDIVVAGEKLDATVAGVTTQLTQLPSEQYAINKKQLLAHIANDLQTSLDQFRSNS